MRVSDVDEEICRMRIIAALLSSVLLVSSASLVAQASTEQPTATPDDLLRKGSDAIRAGKFDEAERALIAAVKTNPHDSTALMDLGMVELRLGKPEEASSRVREAIAQVPTLQGAHLFLGIAYTQMHRLDEAIDALRGEIELDPKNAQAQMWLGVVEMESGHSEKATEPLDRAAELAPNDLNILEYRGKAHSDVAYASYARMATIDPNSWHVHKVQGQIYAQGNQHKEAIAEFQEAIKSMPSNADLYEELGMEYRKTSALDLAQQAFSKELELSPNNSIAMYNLAKIDIETNHVEDGLGLLRKVVANYSNVPATYFYLGLGEFDIGKPEEAVVALEKARAMHPEPDLAPRIEYELSRVYRKLGRLDESARAVREYTRLKVLNAKVNPATPSISAGTDSSNSPTPEAHDHN
jgi:tetratricopeptide (TPR) repeat protein